MKAVKYAPATLAVRDFPARTLLEAKASMERWSEQIKLIDALLAHDSLLPVDRVRLTGERKAIGCAALACANVVAACEKEMRRQAAALEKKWGWLL